MSTNDPRSLTTCSICLDTLKIPKALPCLHTFCLECLLKHVDDAGPGDQFSCPLCRLVVTIPTDGLPALPTNFLIIQILQSSFHSEQSSSDFDNCGMCEISVCTKYCIECAENMCDNCAINHTKLRFAKTHRIVPQEELRNSTV